MAKFYPALTEQQQLFIRSQKIFFTASASQHGRINLSPKGMDSLRILSPNRVAYLDLTGSGNESAAHLLENGRMTLMFCSFDEAPLILRLYGSGRAVQPRSADWNALRAQFHDLPGERQIIELVVDSVQTSCGYAVPQYVYAGERDTLARWAEKKGAGGLLEYWREKNRTSIDGLPSGLLEG